MENHKKHIAILGAGAAGTALFVNLVDQAIHHGREGLEISLIEKTGVFGPGLAYSTEIDTNLLNSPSVDVGIVYGYKMHFWSWIIENVGFWQPHFPNLNNYGPNTPIPRRLYGLYLKTMLKHACHKAVKAGIITNQITDEVVEIEKEIHQYKLKLKDGAFCSVDSVCCCIGLGKRINHVNLIEQSTRYFCFPGSDEKKLLAIPREANVAIIGTRLSAIDSILILANNQHKGKIVSVSRTASMPNVVSKHTKYKPQFLTEKNLLALTDNGKKPLSIKQLLALVKKEYAFHEGKKLNFKSLLETNKKPLVKFRYDIMNTANKIRPWQASFYATNDVVNLIWGLLSSEAKKHSQQYIRLFQSQRIAMPSCNAQQIYQLYRRKKLSFCSGIKNITKCDDKFLITLDQQSESLVVDYLIDAAGLTGSVSEHSAPLVKQLLKQNLIKMDNFGFIAISSKNMKVLNDYSDGESIYILGGLAQGTCIAANLMESIVGLSYNIVRDLLNL